MAKSSIKILVAGDYCPQNRVSTLIEEQKFGTVLGEIKEVLSMVDYSIVNLECPITKGNENPIQKVGPNLSSSRKGLAALKWTGFRCVTLANNHILDYGESGLENTLRICSEYKIDNVGAGANLSDASKPLYKTIGGNTIAIINCCEHEFSIATEKSGGANPLNLIDLYYTIKEARIKSDYLLMIIHGGNEHYQYPSPRMKQTYRFFIDIGADVIINHHQHCFSGYEVYKGKPIFYGLGNFCFDKASCVKTPWNEGFMVILNLGEYLSFNLKPYLQCSYEANISILSDSVNFEDILNDINKKIQDDAFLNSHYQEFLNASEHDIEIAMSPYGRRRIFMLLRKMHLIPSFVSNSKKMQFLAYLQCESHFPKVINYLKN